jgi:hypothetical protein
MPRGKPRHSAYHVPKVEQRRTDERWACGTVGYDENRRQATKLGCSLRLPLDGGNLAGFQKLL